MHSSTSENDLIFKRKLLLVLIELKHFKATSLNEGLNFEACTDSGGEYDVILKEKHGFFIHESEIFCYDCVNISLYSLDFISGHLDVKRLNL